jgi:hypothetical protein
VCVPFADSTQWRTGTRGMTRSTSQAVVSAMRGALHEGQMPRRLQENTTSFSWPHPAQRSLRKPWARMPHSKNASNPSLTLGQARRAPGLDLGEERLEMSAQGDTGSSSSGRRRS